MASHRRAITAPSRVRKPEADGGFGRSDGTDIGLDDNTPVTGMAVASKKRNADFHELFPSIPEGDYLIEDYDCALHRETLIHGRLYLSENHICFYASKFGWITDLSIPIYDIISLEKKTTTFVNPNGIQISTLNTKYTFVWFLSRDTTFDLIYGIWRVVLPENSTSIFSSARASLEGTLTDHVGHLNDAAKAAASRVTHCACGRSGNHLSEIALEAVIPGTPDRIHNLIFASDFIKDFMTEQGMIDVQMSDWVPLESGSKLLARNVSYVKLFGGRYDKREIRDETIHADPEDYITMLKTTKIPGGASGDVYSIKTRTCIMWASAITSKVIVTTQVEWTGRSFIKNFIEKSAIDGQRNYYANLEKAMRAYIQGYQSEFVPIGINPPAIELAESATAISSDVDKFGPGNPDSTSSARASLEGISTDQVGHLNGAAVNRVAQCACGRSGNHLSEVVLEAIVPGTPDCIHNLMFASGFIKDFMTVKQKLIDIQMSDWVPLEPGSKLLARSMSYIKPLNGDLGPKQAKCEIRDETIHANPEDYLTMLTTTRAPDVPNGSVFSVKTRTCIMWASATTSKVIVTTQVEWTNRSWIKSIIEKFAIDGQKDYYADLERAMRAYIQGQQSKFVPTSVGPSGIELAELATAVQSHADRFGPVRPSRTLEMAPIELQHHPRQGPSNAFPSVSSAPTASRPWGRDPAPQPAPPVKQFPGGTSRDDGSDASTSPGTGSSLSSMSFELPLVPPSRPDMPTYEDPSRLRPNSPPISLPPAQSQPYHPTTPSLPTFPPPHHNARSDPVVPVLPVLPRVVSQPTTYGTPPMRTLDLDPPMVPAYEEAPAPSEYPAPLGSQARASTSTTETARSTTTGKGKGKKRKNETLRQPSPPDEVGLGGAVNRVAQCACGRSGNHLSEIALEAVIPGTPDRIHNLMFTSGFIKDFMTEQKLIDIQMSDWVPLEPGSKLLARTMSYIKPFKCEIRDETIHADPEDYITVLTTTRTPDVPSGDVFFVKTQTCIMWASASTSKVVVTTQVEWTGQSSVKGIIEKSAIDGQRNYYADLERAMRAYIQGHQSEFVPIGVGPSAIELAKSATAVQSESGPGSAVSAGEDLSEEAERRKREHIRNRFELQWAWDAFDGAYQVSTSRFDGLSSCVYFELVRRYPEFTENTDVILKSLWINDVTPGPDFETTAGDSGWIFRGQHKGRPVTLQLTYKVHHDNNPETKNYYRDVLAWRSLCHRYILPLLGIFEVKSQIFLVSPLMINGTLTEWRKKQSVPDVAVIHNLMRDVAEGLWYIHSKGIVHGNLCGENIFLDSTFRCQISGFELARDSAPTTSSMLNFVAPELFIRSDKCDHSDLDMCYEHHNMRERKTMQTDVYAFGCLYYAIFFDAMPFQEIEQKEIPQFVTDGQRPIQLNTPLMDPRVWTMLNRCWDTNPSERPTMEQIVQSFTTISVSLLHEALSELEALNTSVVNKSTLHRTREHINVIQNYWSTNPSECPTTQQLIQMSATISVSSLLKTLSELEALGVSLVNENTLRCMREILDLPEHFITQSLSEGSNNSHVKLLLEFILCLLHQGSLIHCSMQDANQQARKLMLKLISTDAIPESLFITDVETDFDPVGIGGFGRVFGGEYNGQKVALKMLDKGRRRKGSLTQDFCREALAWRSFSHRFILPLLGIFENKSQLYLVSPFMMNGTLSEWRKGQTSPISQLHRMMLEVAEGILYIHSEDIVHGDLHGGNVLLDSDLHCQITDFGSTRHSEATVTQSTTALSLGFAAPELFGMCIKCGQFDCEGCYEDHEEQHRSKTTKTDVYAFGCLYYSMFFDTVPFQGNSDFQVIRLLTKGKRPHRLESPRMADNTWNLIQCCWESIPSKRPTMKEIVKMLTL